MFMLAKMAFRNIFRFKRRTMITFSAVSVGLLLLIVSISLVTGLGKQSTAIVLNSQYSHLTVFKAGYFEKKDDLPIGISIRHPEKIRERLSEIAGVRAAECRIRFPAGLIKGMDELPCIGVGIETDRDPEMFNIRQSLREGSWLGPEDDKILVGFRLASDFALRVGDIVTLRLITSDREENLSWNAMDFTIAGIFDTGNPLLDASTVFLPLKQAQTGLGLDGAASEISLRLRVDPEDARAMARIKMEVVKALATEKESLEVISWKEMDVVTRMIVERKNKTSLFIILIMLFVASIGIVNTMLMAVMERTREIGMLSAMGMRRGEILWLFVIEGGVIGVLGSILGCILGGIGAWLLKTRGISISFFGGNATNRMMESFFPVKNVMYGDFSFKVLALTFLLGTVISVLASLYPAYKAGRLDPIEALRHI